MTRQALPWLLVAATWACFLEPTALAWRVGRSVMPERRLGPISATLSSTTSTSKEAVGMPYDERLLYMGISQELDELSPGQSLWGDMGMGIEPRKVEVRKLSQRPALFLLKKILSEEDCSHIQQLAEQSGNMVTAETRRGGNDSSEYRKKSQMAWISNTQHPELARLAESVQSLFFPFEPFDLELSVEELQVVKYDAEGEYKYHHDGALRILTVLYYLNGVSETSFPLADHGRRMRSRDEALKEANRQTTTTQNGNRRGVLVSSSKSDRVVIERGDAVCWYGYFQDATFEWNAIHAGLPASSTKWIATHWYHHVRRR